MYIVRLSQNKWQFFKKKDVFLQAVAASLATCLLAYPQLCLLVIRANNCMGFKLQNTGLTINWAVTPSQQVTLQVLGVWGPKGRLS